jgi:hypothetical protein
MEYSVSPRCTVYVVGRPGVAVGGAGEGLAAGVSVAFAVAAGDGVLVASVADGVAVFAGEGAEPLPAQAVRSRLIARTRKNHRSAPHHFPLSLRERGPGGEVGTVPGINFECYPL